MKKLILLSASLFFCTCLLLGQSKWSFGAAVHAGFSGTSDSHSDYYSNPNFGGYESLVTSKLQPAMGAGLWVERRLGKHWGVLTGIDYLSASTFSRSESISYNLDGDMSYYSKEERSQQQQQIQIPLEAHFYFGKESQCWRPFLSAGLQAQYLWKEKSATEGLYGGSGQETSEYLTIRELDFDSEYLDYQRTQLGYNFGIGIASDRMSLTLRQNQSLGGEGSSFGCPCVYCNSLDVYYYDCAYPSYNNNRQFQLKQTSLRFAYRLR